MPEKRNNTNGIIVATRECPFESLILKHLVANLVSALADLNINNFAHYTGKQDRQFGGPNPQTRNISFVANGLLSSPSDGGIDKSASRFGHQ